MNIKVKPGDVFAIPLRDGTYGYGQIGLYTLHIVFDYRTEGIVKDLDLITSQPILYRTGLEHTPFRNKTYEIIGNKILNGKFTGVQLTYKREATDFFTFYINTTDSTGSDYKKVDKDECIGLYPLQHAFYETVEKIIYGHFTKQELEPFYSYSPYDGKNSDNYAKRFYRRQFRNMNRIN